MCWAICHDRVSRDAREGLGRKCGSRGLAPTCAGKNAGADRLVERGATAAHVFRRWKRRSEKAERKDVPSSCPGVHDPRAGIVRTCTCRRLPANSRDAAEERSVLEYRLG